MDLRATPVLQSNIDSSTTVHTPQTQPSMPSTPLSFIPRKTIHGDDDLLATLSSQTGDRSALLPADCRTLRKIIDELGSLSSASTASEYSSLSTNTNKNGGSFSNNEDEVCYTNKQFDYGGEREEVYADEDGSMDLSDKSVQAEVHEGDTIRDIMNLPGEVTKPLRGKICSGTYVRKQHENTSTDLYRLEIEQALEEEKMLQDQHQMVTAEEDRYDESTNLSNMPDRARDGGQDPLFQAVQEEITMCAVGDQESNASGLELVEDHGRLPLSAVSTHAPRRRTSDGSPFSYSFVTNPERERAFRKTPGGDFPESVPGTAITETSCAQTLRYFKQHDNSKRSPSRRGLKASSPNEIGELARGARVQEEEASEEEDLRDLEKYRDMDFAPLELVINSSSAGDLITFGTPVKMRDASVFVPSPMT